MIQIKLPAEIRNISAPFSCCAAQDLETFLIFTGEDPRPVLQFLIDHEKEAIPFLQKILDLTIKHVDELKEPYMAHIYSLYLLAQFRAKSTYSSILPFFSLTEDQIYQLFNDEMIGELPALFAQLFNGSVETLEKALSSDSISMLGTFLLFETCAILCQREQITKDQLSKLIHMYLENRKVEDEWLFVLLSHIISTFKLDTLYEEMIAILDNEPEVATIVTKSEFIENYESKDLLPDYNPKVIDNIINELDWESENEPYEAPEKIGRNDPCPCGSGKKYKKCCLSSS